MTAPTYTYTQLDRLEVLHDRPFTDISLNADDTYAMRHMAEHLYDLLNGPDELPVEPRPLHINLAAPNGGHVRVILNHVDRLQQASDLYIVGFFGQTRPGADRTAIDGMDITLQGEFSAYPAVLGYCTTRLEDGNFGNLVILDVDGARQHWRESTHHQYAVAELAPAYYASVRLHNGMLLGGLKAEPEIQLKRTKYYDYANGFWCGLREL
jgi:hypothetical protein